MSITYFFERRDGTVFACEHKEFSDQARRFRFVGSSDGTTYTKTIAALKPTLMAKRNKVTLLQNKLNVIQDKMATETDDAKMTVLQAKNDAALAEWEKARLALGEADDLLLKQAFDAELAVARKNMSEGKSPAPADDSITVFGARDPEAVRKQIMGM